MSRPGPLPNRVLPTGEIVAVAARGTLMGNRGILVNGSGRLGPARWRHPHWVCCRLAFRGRKRQVMTPGQYTELFFLDEAVALAAGHRPCAECRRDRFEAYRAAWTAAGLPGRRAPEIDARLHRARVTRTRAQVRHEARAEDLPDGTFVLTGGAAHLLLDGALLPYAPEGYGPPLTCPGGRVTVLTPAPTVAVLRAGYRPELHPTALSPRPSPPA